MRVLRYIIIITYYILLHVRPTDRTAYCTKPIFDENLSTTAREPWRYGERVCVMGDVSIISTIVKRALQTVAEKPMDRRNSGLDEGRKPRHVSLKTRGEKMVINVIQ